MTQKRRCPREAGNVAQAGGLSAWQVYRKPTCGSRLQDNWRDRLPDPSIYYSRHVEKLGKPNAESWAQGRCPLHEDRHESLSVRLCGRGGWRCFAGCGKGDLLSFHMRRTGLQFVEAVRDLVGWRP
jgi:hypothetical protein